MSDLEKEVSRWYNTQIKAGRQTLTSMESLIEGKDYVYHPRWNPWMYKIDQNVYHGQFIKDTNHNCSLMGFTMALKKCNPLISVKRKKYVWPLL